MTLGEDCLLMIPSHLAFGLLGDLEKIPPSTPVGYRVKLIQIQP
jgi:FKBP-type peptidyl-prolyl cis-trans isomerase